MGWSSGSELAERIWDTIRKHIPKKQRLAVAQKIIGLFEHHDCDTLHECEQLCEDAGIRDEEEE